MKSVFFLVPSVLLSGSIMAETVVKTTEYPEKSHTPAAEVIVQVNGQQVNPISKPKADTFAKANTASQQSRVTVYRVANSPSNGVARITLNDRYWASLQPNGFAQICIQPSRFQVQVSLVRDGQAVVPAGPIGARSLNPEPGVSHYFRITDRGAGILQISPVSEAFALTELTEAQRQVHSVRRVPESVVCQEASEFVAAAAPVSVIPAAKPLAPPGPLRTKESFSLGADALFAFGKSDIRSLSAKGKHELDVLSQKIQAHQQATEGTTVLVTGHADPIGKPSSNQRLSEARAKTVRAYLIETGLAPGSVSSTGKGSTAPLVKGCGNKATPKTIVCNAPNRRVDIDVRVP